ncbi:MAG: methionine sulfoxide reductase B [Hyphomonas sp. BRH_c22]|uniref:peptide-methionine (R)-S-oxide reductase MsrB n=1 Tax=Hyphomonas sp. BRH_c22 TaxID=1629710 RepID=UPI0005F0D051|nr:MAG: methionine sulfoxide reductase B [Hyphomonas sp. BRH_c22]
MTRMAHRFSRRTLLLSGSAALAVAACSSAGADKSEPGETADAYAGNEWRALTEDQWRERLEPAAFNVLRKADTERAFTSPLNAEKRDGTYHCAGCDLPLFSSATKFDSGTGWPSFYDVLPGAMATSLDRKLIYTRTEYHCARCLGHQGHVFDDGPAPTGQRWCNNGVALAFRPA